MNNSWIAHMRKQARFTRLEYCLMSGLVTLVLAGTSISIGSKVTAVVGKLPFF